MNDPIYLDYAATTPVAPEVAEAMSACLTMSGNFGNAASRSHVYGWRAEEAVENARLALASLLNADTREIVWTSGATEASNLALKGFIDAKCDFVSRAKAHVVTTSIEHKSVLDTCAHLHNTGLRVSYVAPRAEGDVSCEDIISEIGEDTVLVSVMHANNETGAINDIASIGAACRKRGVAFHVDAAQTVGKLDIDVKAMCVDLLSVSAHKFYGPKGAGALFVRRAPEINVYQQMHGGGHERGMRSGTLANHQIVGLGKAAELAKANMSLHTEKLKGFRKLFVEAFSDLPHVSLNGRAQHQLPGIVNLAFEGIDGETLLLSLRDLAVSSGSACMSATIEPSYVLKAMGLSDSLADSSLRFSFGAFTTEQEIRSAIDSIRTTVARLRN